MRNLTLREVSRFLDLWVLDVVEDHTPHGYNCEGYGVPLRCFTNDWMTKDVAGAVCRSLRDRGHLVLLRGLFNDDGEVAGSGYSITAKGREYRKELLK